MSRRLLLSLLILLLTACTTAPAALPPLPTLATFPTPAPTASPSPAHLTPTSPPPLATPSPTPFTPQPGVYLAPYLPAAFTTAFKLPSGWQTAAPEQASVQIGINPHAALSQWVYALAAPFPTLVDEVTFEDLRGLWEGAPPESLVGISLATDAGTAEAFGILWGAAAPGSVRILPPQDLLQTSWDSGSQWALIPFESIEPRWKILRVDGQSPLQKTFNPQTYPLILPIGILAQAQPLTDFLQAEPILPLSNRDPQKLTVVALTGVTALVRATAFVMERKGTLYPGQDVRAILRAADIAHVSNEIPFTPNCPFPNPDQSTLVFCSDPKYLALLQDIGTDVIELSGDHFNDWGADAMRYTLNLYDENNLPYYGGGYTESDAKKPLLLEHNGNKLAFLGCNGKGGGYATARGENPGAVACDFDYLTAEIARLRAEGYLPIMTFQHFEYYTYAAQPKQIEDFQRVAAAGAVVVSGSQAHQPQAFEFHGGALIHYGLGNLFFDQYFMGTPTAQGFIDQHIFYDGRYLGLDSVGIWFVDFARPRLMTPAERRDLLQSVFEASGW
ncbi:MAG: hypothetical protein OHK0052_14050 [Anaerolineales bacterium]